MRLMKSARQKKDVGIYGWNARWYDKNSRKFRMSEMKRYADLVEARLDTGATILEVAPGPGYLAIELARRGFRVTGVELSTDFVEIEKRNAAQANVSCEFKQGNASALPIANGEIDFVICTAAFKNFKEPLNALNEMYRILRPQGMALIADMNHAATNQDINDEIAASGMTGFDRLFVKAAFKTFLKGGAYTKEGFETLIRQTGFSRYHVIKQGIGLQVWLFKGGQIE